MKRDNIIIVLLLIPALIFLGYGLVSELSKDCRTASNAECRLLWGTTILSVIGGVWLTVLLIKRRPTQFYEPRTLEGKSSPKLGIWHRATLRVILSSLLAAAPLLVRGSFVAVVAGTGIGMMLVGLFGRLTGWISDEENA